MVRREHPVGLAGVVDEEVNVGWHGGGLDGREIGALDLCIRELVPHLDSPLASSGS